MACGAAFARQAGCCPRSPCGGASRTPTRPGCARSSPETSAAAPVMRGSSPPFSTRLRIDPARHHRKYRAKTREDIMYKSNKRMAKAGVTRRDLLLGVAASGAMVAPRNFGFFTPAIAQSNPLRIGVMAPLSGVYASLGTNKVNGIRMLLAEKNNQVEGRPVQLIIEDTEAKPQEGLRKARKLVEQDNA